MQESQFWVTTELFLCLKSKQRNLKFELQLHTWNNAYEQLFINQYWAYLSPYKIKDKNYRSNNLFADSLRQEEKGLNLTLFSGTSSLCASLNLTGEKQIIYSMYNTTDGSAVEHGMKMKYL